MGGMKKIILAFAAAASLCGGAAASEPAAPAAQEARIPFLHISRFRTFRAVDRETLYIENRRNDWYRITTLGHCPGLPFAMTIGVDTRGSPTLDRFSTLVVDGDRCAIQSVVRSGPPPPRQRRRG